MKIQTAEKTAVLNKILIHKKTPVDFTIIKCGKSNCLPVEVGVVDWELRVVLVEDRGRRHLDRHGAEGEAPRLSVGTADHLMDKEPTNELGVLLYWEITQNVMSEVA